MTEKTLESQMASDDSILLPNLVRSKTGSAETLIIQLQQIEPVKFLLHNNYLFCLASIQYYNNL